MTRIAIRPRERDGLRGGDGGRRAGQIRDAIVAVVIADRPAGVLETGSHHGVTGLLVDRRSLGKGSFDVA